MYIFEMENTYDAMKKWFIIILKVQGYNLKANIAL